MPSLLPAARYYYDNTRRISDGFLSAPGLSCGTIEHGRTQLILMCFLSHLIPTDMQFNAADLLLKALEGSTASFGCKVTLDRLKIHSV